MNVQKVKQLIQFDTPTVANGLEMLEVQDPTVGYTGPDVRALTPELGPRIGVAVTARLDSTTGGMDHPPSLFNDWLRAIQQAAKSVSGEVLPVFTVMESVGPKPRYTVTIGDGMATRMKLAGAVGFVTNGSIRDLSGVRDVPLACWGTGLSPMHGRLRWLDINSPVVIDGMTVRPGDFVHADENGAMVIPSDAADKVYDHALAVQEREAAMFTELRQPGLTIDDFLASQK